MKQNFVKKKDLDKYAMVKSCMMSKTDDQSFETQKKNGEVIMKHRKWINKFGI